MHWTQIAYPLLLAIAVWVWRTDWRITAVLFANFFLTFELSSDPYNVAIVDLASVAAFIAIGTWQARILAATFAVIVPIYIFGHNSELSNASIYEIVDYAAFLILGVIIGGGGGSRIGLLDRLDRRTRNRFAVTLGGISPRRTSEDR